MNLLIIHQNFPGQFRHVALEALHRRLVVVAVGRDTAPGVAGVKLYRYRPSRKNIYGAHACLHKCEEAVSDGQQVKRILLGLNQAGFRPDVILAHPGWGETLFVKDVYPEVPLVHLCEYYYRAQGADSDFDPEFPCAIDAFSRLGILNSMHLLNIEQCNVGIAPTQWQRSLFPKAYQSKIRVIHEGVVQVADSENLKSVTLSDGCTITAGQPVVTYVARNLEPYRGFHSFMRAIPRIQEICPNAQIIVIGGEGVSYGRMPVGYPNWRSKMLAEVDVDISRVHFVGKLTYQTYRSVLSLSKAHVYLTYPFVLSWSLLEAMASGCVVIGSDTAPVREIIESGANGILVDFFDAEGIASAVCRVLTSFGGFESMKDAARLKASEFDVVKGVSGYFEVFNELMK
ncbi:glycosyltransferase family 4 protein [Pseudomonas sp. COW5]|uniref:glycosyltransferase family 4 protein n=1 Tax=Pseudomonas sp. COW5 TaxID=2981253 RepID=UPI002246B661|nr:glycosyltransferase family 4 protein [Pseudomonas sp. COW5]MCX2542054.1 glycosyltransferase family 4 protein [Pseudomonas sp. COW5]